MEGTFRGHLAQSPCSEQGHLQQDQAAQNPVQPDLQCFQGWGLHYLSRQPLPVFYYPYFKIFFLISSLNLPSLSLKPLLLVLLQQALLKIFFPSFLQDPFRYWKTAIRSPRSLLFCRLNNSSSPNLSSQQTTREAVKSQSRRLGKCLSRSAKAESLLPCQAPLARGPSWSLLAPGVCVSAADKALLPPTLPHLGSPEVSLFQCQDVGRS